MSSLDATNGTAAVPSLLEQALALEAAAAATPPIVPQDAGVAIVFFAYFFAIVCTIVVGARIYVRTVMATAKWWWDDYLAVLGYVSFIPSNAFSILAANYGCGARDIYQTPLLSVRAMENILYFELINIMSSLVTKVAICLMILRLLCEQRRYQIIMYATLVVVVFVTLGSVIFILADCRPLAVMWNPYRGQCDTANGFVVVSYLVSSVQVATDWTCALLPFFIVGRLQLAPRKKWSVVAILALGVLASIGALCRIPFYKYLDTVKYPTEIMYHQGFIVLSSQWEIGLGIIACSLPPLRRLFSRFYHGSSNGSRGPSRAYVAGSGAEIDPGQSNGRFSTPLTALGPQGKSRATVSANAAGSGKWEQLDDDNSSRKHIVRQTEVLVSTHMDSDESLHEDSSRAYRGTAAAVPAGRKS